jgi:lipid-A-disaccharide synthase-like uncharacterized protein
MIESVIEFLKSAVKDQIVGDPVWATIALIGQFIFAGRFIVQWIASELKKRSHVPNSFWFLSLIGSFILLSYSVHLKNPIFMLAFSLNTLIYLRNLQLIYRPPNRGTAA